jgi:DNA-binding NarL/FixJ family response regulator
MTETPTIETKQTTAAKRAEAKKRKIVEVRGVDKNYAVSLTAEDLEELREREATVDENGMRVLYLEKDEQRTDRLRLMEYKRQGYEVEDTGDEYILKIANSVFQEREAVRQAKVKELMSPIKKTSVDGVLTREETMEDTISSSELAAAL